MGIFFSFLETTKIYANVCEYVYVCVCVFMKGGTVHTLTRKVVKIEQTKFKKDLSFYTASMYVISYSYTYSSSGIGPIPQCRTKWRREERLIDTHACYKTGKRKFYLLHLHVYTYHIRTELHFF